MMNYFSMLGLLMFSISLLSFTTRFKHLISMLLSLEMMALGVLLILSSMLSMKNTEDYILIPFLTMIVCEGSMGLSILVGMVRHFGNEHMKTSSLIKI